MRRLQTDYIDLYQAHRYDYETPLEETMQAFADLVRQGKVLYLGSASGPPAGSRATDDKGGANMIARWMRDDALAPVIERDPAKTLESSPKTREA